MLRTCSSKSQVYQWSGQNNPPTTKHIMNEVLFLFSTNFPDSWWSVFFFSCFLYTFPLWYIRLTNHRTDNCHRKELLLSCALSIFELYIILSQRCLEWCKVLNFLCLVFSCWNGEFDKLQLLHLTLQNGKLNRHQPTKHLNLRVKLPPGAHTINTLV